VSPWRISTSKVSRAIAVIVDPVGASFGHLGADPA
jgi:hypothetical protein